MAINEVYSLDGKRIGCSRGRYRIEHYHTMISVADLDVSQVPHGNVD